MFKKCKGDVQGMKKSIEKDIAEIIGEISKVSALINIKGNFTVFLNISGHVKKLDIKVIEGEWEANKKEYLKQDFVSFNDERDLIILKSIRDKLYKILNNSRINLKNCNFETEEIKHYKFY